MLEKMRRHAAPIVALLGCLSIVACGEETETVDSGTSVADGGTPPVDSGTPPVDSGASPDAGARDASSPPACTLTAPTECPSPAPTFAEVQPIFQARCVTCHFGAVGGPWPLTSYGHITDWTNEVRAAVLTCAMPPPDMADPLPEAEATLILNWLRCGAPR